MIAAFLCGARRLCVRLHPRDIAGPLSSALALAKSMPSLFCAACRSLGPDGSAGGTAVSNTLLSRAYIDWLNVQFYNGAPRDLGDTYDQSLRHLLSCSFCYAL